MLSVKKLIDPWSSRPLDKDVQYFLLTRLVEVDGELVVARGDDAPGAKHPVHDMIANGELGGYEVW